VNATLATHPIAPGPSPLGDGRCSSLLRLGVDSHTDVSGEGGFARFHGVLYTGAVVEQQLGRFVIDLATLRLPEPGVKKPVILDHCCTRIGFTENVRIDGGSIVCDGVLLTDGDGYHHEIARDIVADAKAGYPHELSLGLEYDEKQFVPAGESVEVNGETYAGPITVARNGLYREVSFVMLGADPNTSVAVLRRFAGRAATLPVSQSNNQTPDARQGARLMDISTASADDIKKANPDAAKTIGEEAIKASADEAAAKAAETAEEVVGDGGDEKDKEADAGGSGGGSGGGAQMSARIATLRALPHATDEAVFASLGAGLTTEQATAMFAANPAPEGDSQRSEERRVGKECRSRWSPYH